MLAMFVALPLVCLGQVSETFDDGELLAHPTWSGTLEKFSIENNELRLTAPAESSTAYLSTPSKSIENATWKFFVRFDFNPSSANYAKFYLTSDSPVLDSLLHGYFVKLGGTSDEISLYRQDGFSEEEIIDGTDGRLSLSMVEVYVEVHRDIEGNWQLRSSFDPGVGYEDEGKVFDNTYPESSWFGFQVVYTTTRADRSWVDDIQVNGDPFTDRLPPVLTGHEWIDFSTVSVTFSEPIDPGALSTSMFEINSVVPESILPMQDSLILNLSSPLVNGEFNTLRLNGIPDTVGNLLADTIITRFFFREETAIFRDIILTEIMADPNPEVELPPHEYVELYNRSNKPFVLTDWSWSDGVKEVQLDSAFLGPGKFLILCASSAIRELTDYGEALKVSNWPALNNKGDILTLKDSAGKIIDRVSYEKSWYGSIQKEEGGWALEIIDLSNPCGEEANWVASPHPDGGTPGRINAANAEKPDLKPPVLLDVLVESPTRLQLKFNERLDSLKIDQVKTALKPEITVNSVDFLRPRARDLILLLDQSLRPNISYTLTLRDVVDCNGNILRETGTSFLIPEEADSADIVINEILFNPVGNGTDFVELYNRSEKFIDLQNWWLANGSTESPSTRRIISEGHAVLRPKEFVVLTENPATLISHYPLSADSTFRLVESMPAYNDDEGVVYLINPQGRTMDQLHYSQDMHADVIRNPEGVSLERISPDKPTNLKSNWFSAAEKAGFATPGYRNSQWTELVSPTADVAVSPRVFSPNNDGRDDFATISFSLDQPGFVGNIRIYDVRGRIVRNLANNELLPQEGFYTWDGFDEDGARLSQGYYIVFFEVFNLQGIKKLHKTKVAIAGI